MPPTWLSARRGSIRSILNTVRTVFRCVASRNSVARDLVGLFSADVSRPSGQQNALWARHHSSPGNRGYDEGMLMNVGSAGYSCSSGTSGIDVRFLHFHTGAEIYPHNSGHRAHGFPLRCLQEQVERQRLRNTDRESSARRPPPRGALRLGDEAGDAKHRETDPPSFRKIRPRARPPAPACSVRCSPRPAILRIATSSEKLLSPGLSRDLTMTSDTTPGETPVPLDIRKLQRVAASGALRRKPQLSCAERHLAPPGVAVARATLRVAVPQLTTQFSAAPCRSAREPDLSGAICMDRAPRRFILFRPVRNS